MSQKEQGNQNDNASSKQRTPTAAADDFDVIEGHTHPAILSQRAKLDPRLLPANDVKRLQRTIGNQAVSRLLAHRAKTHSRQVGSELRRPLSPKTQPTAGPSPSQGQNSPQPLTEGTPSAEAGSDRIQREGAAADEQPATEDERAGNGGLPAELQAGIERLSGHSLDDVEVHYNSPLPDTYGARAFARGDEIHLGPGNERSLPHEAWHVVQQRQGQVTANVQLNESPVNADPALEREADVMGAKAAAVGKGQQSPTQPKPALSDSARPVSPVMQMDWYELVGEEIIKRIGAKPGGYRLVKGRKAADGSSVFESQAQQQSKKTAPKTYEEQLGELPEKGEFSVAADLVRYSQDSIAKTFKSGASIVELARQLKERKLDSSALPPIRVFMSAAGRLVTLDNRRLWCCKEAGVTVKCAWATEEEIKDESYKFTAKGREGLTTIDVRK